jgi:hypothetical protein
MRRADPLEGPGLDLLVIAHMLEVDGEQGLCLGPGREILHPLSRYRRDDGGGQEAGELEKLDCADLVGAGARRRIDLRDRDGRHILFGLGRGRVGHHAHGLGGDARAERHPDRAAGTFGEAQDVGAPAGE